MNPTSSTQLEHVNVTVTDPDATAGLLGSIFGWTVRWRGSAINGGTTVHIGTEHDYLAVYTPPEPATSGPADSNYEQVNGLNHIGVIVDDLDAIEQRVIDVGLTPYNHADYEPGRRFYFDDPDGIEFEVVSYATAAHH